MERGFRIGRLLGIELRLGWSWIFMFFLVTSSLSGLFARWHPLWSPGLTLAVALIAGLLFFASVLAHELAHSLVARAHGLEVRDITLFLFGGVSNLAREPGSPRTELLTAVAGPLTSLALGAAFTAVGAVIDGMGPGDVATPVEFFARLDPLATLFTWLGPINIMLGLFNLVPAFPLDGGRVLRALLWARSGDFYGATRRASALGRGFGWLFVLFGLAMTFGFRVPFFGTGLGNGLWLALIGWFLLGAASRSEQSALVREALEGVPVHRLTRPAPAVEAASTLSSLVDDRLMPTGERSFLVLDRGGLAGLVCLEDVRKVPRAAWDRTSVRDVMTPASSLVTAAPRDDAADALAKMAAVGVSQLPVLENGQPLGLLRLRDVSRWIELHGPGSGGPLSTRPPGGQAPTARQPT
ncbi:MAG TPA: site-2 protease family protein [Polyangiaceae bacterium]|nr:site-2 protease family protein [Polyangiaceae bacterium]